MPSETSLTTVDLARSLIDRRELGSDELEALIPRRAICMAIEDRYGIRRLPGAIEHGSPERLVATEAALHRLESGGLNPRALDFESWLTTEQPSLSGESPLALLVAGRYTEVDEYADRTVERFQARLSGLSKRD